MIVLRNLNLSEAGKEGRYDSFLAGCLGGYAVFGRNGGSVSNQVCIQRSRGRSGWCTDWPILDRHLRLRPCDALPRQTRH
jgi:hypothetical protein